MLLLISLIGLLALLCTLLQKRFEQVLAPFICGLILAAYPLAMFRGLAWLVWLAALGVLGGILALVVQIVGGRGRDLLRSFGRNFFTPGLLCFVILAALFYAASQHHTVQATDDIYYWGIEAHSIFAHQGLVDATRHLSPRFMTYTPGMQLFQWVGLTIHGDWSESILYFMLWIFYAAFLLPFSQKITWKKAYWIPVFIVFAAVLPPLMNGDAFQMLRVDTALGLCLGYALIQAWSLRKPGKDAGFHLVCFALALCALALLKQIGTGWALMAIALLLFVCRPLKAGAAKPGPVILACAAPFLVFASWLVFSAANGLSGIHLNSASTQIGEILNNTWKAPEGFDHLLVSIWSVLSLPAKSLSLETGRWLELPKIAWMILFTALPLALIFFRREERRGMCALALWVASCFLIFLIGYVFVFMTSLYGASSGFENGWHFGYYLTERYFCPCLISLWMLFAFDRLSSLQDSTKSAPWRGRLFCGVALAMLLLCTDWSALCRDLSWSQTQQYEEDSFVDMFLMENTWVDEIAEKESAIVFYGIESYPFKAEWLQYAITPIKLVLTPETSLTRKAFLNILRSRQITHIVCMDESNPVYENALDFAEDGWLDVWTVYRVNWEAETPLLSYE